MDDTQFDKLTGRIDGIGQALLRVVAALEMRQLIDGPRVSAEWRAARPEDVATDTDLQESRKVLCQLADQLDAARRARAAHHAARPR